MRSILFTWFATLIAGVCASSQTIGEQNKVIFEPEKLAASYMFQLPEHVEERWIKVERMVALDALWYHEKRHRKLVLYFQGNARNLQNFLNNHRMVLDWGYDVLVTDYRGFGKSEGELASETQMFRDAEKVFDYAIGLGYRPEQIVLYGYSLGTGLAAHLASVRRADVLVLESPYSSIAEIEWIGNKAPAYALDTKEKVKGVTIPTLIVHGNRDVVITHDHAKRVYDNVAAKNRKLVVIEGGGHGDLRKRPEYKAIIKSWIDK
jgi:pimeloyl-ACP methyl ester carboxylesterase